MAPLTVNPNAPSKYGDTPIHGAAREGHTEIVKILANLTDNPNAPNNDGRTPSSVTKNVEIRRILESPIHLSSKLWTYRNCQNLGPSKKLKA